MSSNAHHLDGLDSRERLLDLLSQRATEGLTASEELEVTRLLRVHPEVDEWSFEVAAAAAALALLDAEPEGNTALPETLRRRTQQLAGFPVAGSMGRSAVEPLRPRPSPPRAATGLVAATAVGPKRPAFRFAWLAVAAALMLAAAGWWRALSPTSGGPTTTAALIAQYQSFAASAADVVRYPWAGKQPGFEGVRGQVVWSDKQQRGYMLLSGLRTNDPTREQYQLWIVDPARDKNPVDGGVFNIAAAAEGSCTTAGEVIVPIDCKLPVSHPAAFALTVEKPGGVVVSAGPLVVVAAAR